MIKAELSAEEVVALPSDTEPWPGPELTARPTSTSYANYYAQIRTFRHAIGRRKVTKAVLSRRIVAESTLDPFDLASRYFDLCPGTFRALYFTQETGLWLTATPELLLSAHKDSDDDSPVAFETMSLAGTRVPSPMLRGMRKTGSNISPCSILSATYSQTKGCSQKCMKRSSCHLAE